MGYRLVGFWKVRMHDLTGKRGIHSSLNEVSYVPSQDALLCYGVPRFILKNRTFYRISSYYTYLSRRYMHVELAVIVSLRRFTATKRINLIVAVAIRKNSIAPQRERLLLADESAWCNGSVTGHNPTYVH